MGRESVKGNENVYFKARKEAAMYNPKLYSREGAAEMLGVSVSTLADYELGNTKVVPVDKVMLMADLYNCPELRNGYCKYECPIGKSLPVATEIKSLEGIALRLLRTFNVNAIVSMKENLIDITADGMISDEEYSSLSVIREQLRDLQTVISEFQLATDKIVGGIR